MFPLLKWLIGLKQLPQEAGEGDWHLEFQSVPQGFAAVLCFAIVIGIVVGVWWLYRHEGRNLGGGIRSFIGGLRILTFVCLALMLLDIVLVIDRREKTPSQLLVLFDTSESMGLTDPYDESTAREIASTLNGGSGTSDTEQAAVRQRTRLDLARAALEPLLAPLTDGRDVTLYGFDANSTRLEGDTPLADIQPRGAGTAIGSALGQALAAHRGKPLAGVLVVTDGQSNGGEDPRKIAQQAGRDGTAIHSLIVGSEKGPSNVRLSDIEVSPVVFVRDPTQLVVMLESQGMQGRSAAVKLERRQRGEEWVEVGRTELTLGEDASIQRVPFSYTPDATGQFEFRGSVIDAGPELTEDDNSSVKTIKVVRQRIRVLIVAGSPSPEVQFLRNSLLRDPVVDLACWLQSASENYEQVGHRPVRRLPSNAQELSYFDVLVLIDPNMQKLGAGWDEMMTKFVGDAGGGLIYVAGELYTNKLMETAQGGDAGSASDAWLSTLPVMWESGLYQSSADVRLNTRDTWNFELTTDGKEDPIFHFSQDSKKNQEILASLPGMYWHFPVTRAKPGATVLAQHGDQRMHNQFGRHVLMAMQRYGPGRTVFIGFDATYRWRYLHEQYFDGFWSRLIDRVGRSKVLGGRYPFTLSTDKNVYRTGDRVTLRVQLTGAPEESSSIGTLQCEVEVPGSDPVSYELEPHAEQPGLLETSFTVDKGGAYLIHVSSSSQAERDPTVRPATLPFRVEPPRQETDKPGTNRPLLEDLAKASGGRVFTIGQSKEIPTAFTVKDVERLIQYREELWDAPLGMFLIVLLLTLEWVLRKIYRMA
ncbi:vWA domain-containing protein [Schlesneria paludicola]|uniref:vWA domain-containing protein n=1 Tax=Schlesneria paludicola TaxID=360056 RepID=UPI00029A1AD3|nr:vWA domain-containing protein [Schlesneria paludicola]